MIKKTEHKRYVVFSLADGYEPLFVIHSEHDELWDAQSACEEINQYCGIVDRQEKKIVQLKER